MRHLVTVIVALLCASGLVVGCTRASSRPTSSPAAPGCALPGDPEVLVQDGRATLVRWETTWQAAWSSDALPDSEALRAYRAAFEAAGTDVRRPVADPPEVTSEAMAEVWRREDHNADTAFSGDHGEVRPATCLESALLARQAEAVDALAQPTELVVAITARDATIVPGTPVRIYMGASDTMFPPKSVYPFEAAAADVAAGWTFWSTLHNHTPVELDGKPALGTPSPSTNDVQLMRNLAAEHGLQRVQVTNGFYTVDLPTSALDAYQGPP